MEMVKKVERRIRDLGEEIPRFFFQLRISLRRRNRETAARRKGESRKGNNPDGS